ncbi:hypothetical protein ABZX98_00880 [Streptomyces sp. NPDC002992]
MSKTLVDIDDDADDRARALRWLQDNAEDFLDFDVLDERERSGL